MDAVEPLLRDIDAAVFDDARFDAVLGSLTCRLGAETSTLWLLEPPGATAPPLVTVHGMRKDAVSEFANYWHLLDPWSRRAQERGGMPAGLTAIGSELVDRSEVEQSPFYNEWAREHGMSAMLSAVVVGPEEERGPPRSLLCFYRGSGATEFNADDKATLRAVLPRILAAIKMRGLWRAATQVAGDARYAFESLDAAAFVLDRRGAIAHANEQALAILRRPGDAEHREGRLVSLGVRSHPTLADAVNAALKSGLAQAVLVQWAGPPPSLCRAQVLPLPDGTQRKTGTGDRLLLIAERPDDGRWLRLVAAFYSLTPAETRVAEQMMAGFDAAAMADRLGLRLTTVRTHIRQLNKKLAVNRAAEIVRLLGGLRV